MMMILVLEIEPELVCIMVIVEPANIVEARSLCCVCVDFCDIRDVLPFC